MAKALDGRNLQEILLFYIIYFTGPRGRENLKTMTKDTLKIGQNPDGRKFIYQAIDESNKNHNETDTDPSTQACIYEIPSELQ